MTSSLPWVPREGIPLPPHPQSVFLTCPVSLRIGSRKGSWALALRLSPSASSSIVATVFSDFSSWILPLWCRRVPISQPGTAWSCLPRAVGVLGDSFIPSHLGPPLAFGLFATFPISQHSANTVSLGLAVLGGDSLVLYGTGLPAL